MEITFFTTLLMLIPTLFMLLIPTALVAALQVWLCRREIRWLGLILPILSFLVSLILCLSLCIYSTSETVGTASVDGTYVTEETQIHIHTHDLSTGGILSVAAVFLIANVPTAILLGIFFYQKNRRDFRDDLHKMTIQDLE